MAEIIKWPVVLVTPGEDELPLLAELSARRDARIVAVLDPVGTSIGAGLAEIMGLPVIATLAELPPGGARWLVHPPLNDLVASLVDEATALGLEPVLARDFADQVSGPRLAAAPLEATEKDLDEALSGLTRAAARTGQAADLEFLELETAAIHRTLSRIEEALDREALLRWLLGLATRATGATSGSIMLLDHEADELYVAFAYGLSQSTMHRTRVRLGEAVAGRVARTRQAELVCGPIHPGADRDRADLQSAVCAPILWDGSVLGVINVCTAEGEPSLDRDAVTTLESLTHRFGLILDRFLHIQSTGDRLLLREVEERFTRDTGLPETLASTLCAWATDIREVAGADQVSLDILTSDGDLFCATPEGTQYEAPPGDIKGEVLSRGRPRVLHGGEAFALHGNDGRETTVFHLPVGRDPLRALLSLTFSSASRAHHFHGVSSEILLLLNRHLTGFLDRAATADQLDRLTTLAAALSGTGGGTGRRRHRRTRAGRGPAPDRRRPGPAADRRGDAGPGPGRDRDARTGTAARGGAAAERRRPRRLADHGAGGDARHLRPGAALGPGRAPWRQRRLPRPGAAGQAPVASARRCLVHRVRRPLRPAPAAAAGGPHAPPSRVRPGRHRGAGRLPRTGDARPGEHGHRGGRHARRAGGDPASRNGSLRPLPHHARPRGVPAERPGRHAPCRAGRTGLGHRAAPAQQRPHRLPGGRHRAGHRAGGHPVAAAPDEARLRADAEPRRPARA
ncbi:MAG: GAF domain-containing protein [bacterium]|nr:GAF domain-containing protein [bacterium]